MIELAEILLTVLAVGLLVPALVLAVECTASLLPVRRARLSPSARPRVVVIVPAHNESARIGLCLTALQLQLASDDRVIVVADNCVDDTAARAREHGATVLERSDAARPGKGYALLHALDAIAAAPPDVIIVIDADSVAAVGLVETLSRSVATAHGPVQAAYWPELPSRPADLDRVSALAFVAKNVTRPRGLARLALPCLLTGTGMAFPWEVIRGAPIAGGKTAEDMRLAVDLSIAGYPPTFCDEARIVGPMDKWKGGATLQRTRWEHGHLETIFERVLPLLVAALRQRRLGLLALALELSVPPLSLWALLWTIAAMLAVTLAAMGPLLPLRLVQCAGLLIAVSVVVAWARDARQLVSARTLLAAGWYVAQKLPVYSGFLRQRQNEWVLTSGNRLQNFLATRAADHPQHCGRVAPNDQDVRIGPCLVHAITEGDLVQRVVDRLDAGEGGWIVTLNLDHLWHCARDPEYASLCARSTFAVADGMPLVWASRLQGTPLPERVAGSNLIESLSAAAAQHGRSILLVGGMPGDAEAAAVVLRARHPTLRVAAMAGGGRRSDLADEMRRSRPDIVYVSLGKILEEQLIENLRESLPGVWFIGVGTSFAFLSGRVRRAPPWMRQSGLEWIHRWSQEPARLTGRYLRCIPLAIRLLATAAAQRGR